MSLTNYLLDKTKLSKYSTITQEISVLSTIFIVDDSDTNLATAEEALETHYNVMTMPSAEKMFTLLEKITPNLILLDIEMPEMDGFEALKKLKTSASWSNIPVIFLTGTVDASIKEHGLSMGALDIISKPFSVPVLLEKIKAHIK
jgi:putative two-component system response regulator